jgi:hypothetical protein
MIRSTGATRMHTPRALRPFALGAALVAPLALAVMPVAVTAQTLAPGSALISLSGDVEGNWVLPVVPDTVAPTADGFELQFQDDSLDTLNVTLTVDTGRISDTFVGVGVPGTSIWDDLYFADFLHTQCTTQTVVLEPSAVYAAVDCHELSNGNGDKTVDLHAEFTTVGLPAPSGSPASGSPAPSASFVPGSPAPSPVGG